MSAVGTSSVWGILLKLIIFIVSTYVWTKTQPTLSILIALKKKKTRALAQIMILNIVTQKNWGACGEQNFYRDYLL